MVDAYVAVFLGKQYICPILKQITLSEQPEVHLRGGTAAFGDQVICMRK